MLNITEIPDAENKHKKSKKVQGYMGARTIAMHIIMTDNILWPLVISNW